MWILIMLFMNNNGIFISQTIRTHTEIQCKALMQQKLRQHPGGQFRCERLKLHEKK